MDILSFPIPSENILNYYSSFYPYILSLNKSHLLNNKNHAMQMYKTWKFLAIQRFDTLEKLFQSAEKNNISLVVVKGPVFALDFYPSIFSRFFNDIDLFVKPKDYAKAIQMLVNEGYQEVYSPDVTQMHRTFKKNTIIELHYAISRDIGENFDVEHFFFDKTIPIRSDNTIIYAPKPENHLIFIFLHAFNHGYLNPPIWCIDAYLLVRKYHLAFEKIQQQVEGTILKTPVNVGISLIHKVLNIKSNIKINFFEQIISNFVFDSLNNNKLTHKKSLLIRIAMINAINGFSITSNLNFLTSRW